MPSLTLFIAYMNIITKQLQRVKDYLKLWEISSSKPMVVGVKNWREMEEAR